MQDVLTAEPTGRTGWWLALAVLALAAAVPTALGLRAGPPEPFEVRLDSLDGSALHGEAFVRLQLDVRIRGARRLDVVRLQLGGTSALGLSPAGLAGGRATVQVDLVPPCPGALATYVDAVLDVTATDGAGRSHRVRVALPDDGAFARLVRYRCAGSAREAG